MGSADVLVAAADRALYRAKESGRDRAVLATVEPSSKIRAGVGQRSFDSEVQPTVLVVDNDPRILAPLTRHVERMGYKAKSAQGGREALALFEKAGTAADVLLTDVVMPDMNGLILVDELARRGHHVPVIYMSGHVQTQVTWQGLSENVTGFLQKPIEMEELGASIRTALGVERSARKRPDELGDRPEQAAISSSSASALERGEVGVS